MQENIFLEKILSQFSCEKKNLLPILHNVQEKIGYISPEIMTKIASYLSIHPNDILGVVSFYSKFRKKPKGIYPIIVCMGTACYLSGGEVILKTFERELNIKTGDTTDDRLFSLEKAACFGCCTQAPVVKIKDKIYPKMTTSKVEEILVNIKNEISRNKREK